MAPRLGRGSGPSIVELGGGETALEWGRAVRIVADGGGTYGFFLFQIPGPTRSALLLNTIRSWTGPDTWAFGESGAVPGNDYSVFSHA